MRASLQLLDLALEIANQELALLDQDDLDALEDLARRRADLVNKAWEQKDNRDAEELAERLHALRRVQTRLNARAEMEYAKTSDLLKQRKQADKAISGYGRKPRRTLLAQCITKQS